MSEIILQAEHLTKVYHRGSEAIRAVDDVSLSIRKGEFVSVIGPSGSGKTTLINILGCLDNPTSGELTVNGQKIFSAGQVLSEVTLTKVRRELYGYIFQKFYLIPTLTVSENVRLPFVFFQKPAAQSDVTSVLTKLGIEGRAEHLPGQISGGEMQRVAVARALINRPEIILADEPTGNLDTKRGREIGEILRDLNKKEGLTIVLVTHNSEFANMADRTIEIRDGKVS